MVEQGYNFLGFLGDAQREAAAEAQDQAATAPAGAVAASVAPAPTLATAAIAPAAAQQPAPAAAASGWPAWATWGILIMIGITAAAFYEIAKNKKAA